MIAPAPRHARDGLFDNLDRIMALGAGRWRLGACFQWTGSGGHFKGHTRRPVGFLQML